MGNCVDQVNFMEKWNKRQGLKIAMSQQFSNFSMIIFSLSVHIFIRSALSHVNCFVCFCH